MIRAELRTSDDQLHVYFDATAYFERAVFPDLLDLEGVGWGGDTPSDAVALYMLGRVPEVDEFFRFLENAPTKSNDQPVLFECHVREEDVAGWLKLHRPDWYERLW